MSFAFFDCGVLFDDVRFVLVGFGFSGIWLLPVAVSMQFSLLDLGLFVFFFTFAGLAVLVAVLVAALAVTVCCFLIEITGFARRTILVEVL